MPSGPRKRKSMRKNKSSASPPHQNWLRTHMQMLKGPSLGNGSKGKEKNNPAEKGVEGDRKEIDSLENEGNRVSDSFAVAIQSEAEKSQNAGLDESNEEAIQVVTESMESAVSSDVNVERSNVLEEKDREEEDAHKFGVNSSLEKGVSSGNVPAVEQESEQAAVGKAEVSPVLEVNIPANENNEKLEVDGDGSMEVLQNGEMYASTPKTEIPHPPMVVRHAPVWNCCGLLEVFMSLQH